MASNLKSRLARLRDGKALVERAEAQRHDASRPRPAFLDSWHKLGDFVWGRELFYPIVLPETADVSPFLPLPKVAGERREVEAWSLGLPREALRFFDLETTGLSGGSGTVAFLAAVARPAAGGLRLWQCFLEDYPGEPLFIAALLEALGEEAVVASYNGRSFDLPLLRTRCVMNGLAPRRFRDIDLLYPARRLWRRAYGGASLGLLEASLLGKERGPDLPGSAIPGLWFDFLAGRDSAPMSLVLSHNAEDVSTLALLFLRLLEVFSSPLGRGEAIDKRGLGRSLLALGRTGEAEAVLEEAARAGDEAAAIFLSRRFGRERRIADRGRMAALLGDSVAAEVEKAKYLEHDLRDYSRALSCVERAMGLECAEEGLASLRLRRDRLLRKAGRPKGGLGD